MTVDNTPPEPKTRADFLKCELFWNITCTQVFIFLTFVSLTVCILLQRAALLVLMTSQENAFHSLTFLWHRSLLLEVNILNHFSRISYGIRQHFKATKNI